MMDKDGLFWIDEHIDDEEEAPEDGDMQEEALDEDGDMQEEEEEEYDENDEYAFSPTSMCPPAHGVDDSWHRYVLLDLEAYFSDRRNATTASCVLSGDKKGRTIHVTFCTAAPPLVSYFSVDFTGSLNLCHFAEEPRVVASEGGLALINVAIGDQTAPEDPNLRHYFMYHAGLLGEVPTLTQLPQPKPYSLHDCDTVILRHCPNRHRYSGFMLAHHGAGDYHDCSHCGYTIACLLPAHTQHSYQYQLLLLRSDTMAWSCETIMSDKKTARSHRDTTNTVTIPGELGTVGWVDLWRGILFCDVLATEGRRTIRHVPLPPPLVQDMSVPQPPSDIPEENKGLRMGTPRSSRDIAVVGDFLKCLDLRVRAVPGMSSFTADGWSATVWRMKVTGSLSAKWKVDRKIDSRQLLSDSLPKLKVDAGTPQPTLQSLHIGQPTLSLEDDGIVYFLSKIDFRDDERSSWVMAVDTGKKMIRGVADFSCARTLGFGPVYSASRISEYLHATRGTKETQKRLGIPLPGSPAKKHHGVHSWVHEINPEMLS